MKRPLLLSLLCAIGFSLSFPPSPLGFLAYFALIPFFMLLNPLGLKEAFRWGYFTGLFISLGTIYWIYKPTLPGAIAAILYHPLYFGLFGLGYAYARQRIGEKVIFAAPFLWVSMEYLKSLGEIGFPWVTIGYTQSYYTYLIQYAEYTSVYGVSFWIVWLNVCVYQMLKHSQNRRAMMAYGGAFAALIALPLIHGRWTVPDELPQSRYVRVAVVQGNIDPYLKWDKNLREMNFAVYERLTLQVGREDADVIIWPETATPTYLLHDRAGLLRVRRLVFALDTPILTGTMDYIRMPDRSYKTFNSIVLIDKGSGPYQKYAKMHLVPFGERVPWEDDIALIKKLLSRFEMGEGNFSPGAQIVLFDVPIGRSTEGPTNGSKVRVGGVICFESIFSELVRQFVRRGAQLLVVVTNDGWFGRTSAPFQHAQMAVFRAIENRISVARSANTGVSMTIDPYGRVRKQTPIFKEAVIVDNIPIRTKTTFFTKHGHVFTRSVVLLTILMLMITSLTSKRPLRT